MENEGPVFIPPPDAVGFVVWVCGRIEVMPEGYTRWHIQGIFYRESAAAAACRDESYFIGPIPFGVVLPEKVVRWSGAYYPLGKDKKKQ